MLSKCTSALKCANWTLSQHYQNLGTNYMILFRKGLKLFGIYRPLKWSVTLIYTASLSYPGLCMSVRCYDQLMLNDLGYLFQTWGLKMVYNEFQGSWKDCWSKKWGETKSACTNVFAFFLILFILLHSTVCYPSKHRCTLLKYQIAHMIHVHARTHTHAMVYFTGE